MSGEINSFSFSFRENFPRVMKGVCGSGMKDPLGECSLVRMADRAVFVVSEKKKKNIMSCRIRKMPRLLGKRKNSALFFMKMDFHAIPF